MENAKEIKKAQKSPNPEDKKKSKNLHKAPWQLGLMRFVFNYPGHLFPALIGRWAYKLWFKTHRSPRPRRELDWFNETNPSIEVIEVGGIPLATYYWENSHYQHPSILKSSAHEKPLVILHHGWTGRGSQMAAFVDPLLQAGFRVLAFDNHAHGETPGKATSIFILSETLQGLAEKVGPVYAIIAHSFGGMVAAHALAQGTQTKKVVSIHDPISQNGFEVQKVVCISSPARFDFLLERFSNSLYLPRKIQQYMINRFKKEYGDDLVERVSATHTSQCLGHIPTLFIHDENDVDVPIFESELFHKAWPHSKIKRTRGLGHRAILYNHEVLEMVTNFIKK